MLLPATQEFDVAFFFEDEELQEFDDFFEDEELQEFDDFFDDEELQELLVLKDDFEKLLRLLLPLRLASASKATMVVLKVNIATNATTLSCLIFIVLFLICSSTG